VLRLLQETLGPGPAGRRTEEFFRWKHAANPFGRSLRLLAVSGGRIVGFRSFLRWRFDSHDRAVRAVRAVDTATHRDFRRMGVFSRLTRNALEILQPEVDLVFNTPNAASGPGYLKLGWRSVGKATVSVRIRRPLRVLRGLRSLRVSRAATTSRPPIEIHAERASEALGDADAVSSLLEAAGAADGRLATSRDVAFLRWRYGDAPHLDYRAVREVEAGQLSGLAIFRVRPRGSLWQCSVADVIVAGGDVRTAQRLLQRAVIAAPVDVVVLRMPSGSAPAGAAVRSGFVPTLSGQTLVVNPLSEGLRPDPTDRRSWALSLGDLEVF
jgi:hypothetical protein